MKFRKDKDFLKGLDCRVNLGHYAMTVESPEKPIARHRFPKITFLKTFVRILLGLILIGLLALFVPTLLLRTGLLQAKPKITPSTTANPSQVLTINKKYTFGAFDDTGKKKGTVDFTITTVEKTDSVIVQDKTYTAKNEKTFLIVNLELKNDSTKRYNINSSDLVRLIVNDQEEKKFSPDLHNNFVAVAAISTKIDRLGFVIYKKQAGFTLQVGELEGDKDVVTLNF